MATYDVFKPGAETGAPSAYLVFDTESVPDGRLLAMTKYAGENLSPEDAVARAQAETRERSPTQSDFLPVTYQYPVAVCVLRVGSDFGLQAVTCLDAPQFRPRKIVEAFWSGLATYQEKYKERIKLVTFNGRGFDLPLLELAAFRYGCSGRAYFLNSRNRFGSAHLDLMDWLANFGATRFNGGMNLLSKLLGKPGKMEVKGSEVYGMYQRGQAQEINDYCLCDTLDTYFIFLRTRVLTGDLTLEQEHILVMRAREWLTAKAAELPALGKYLDNWGDWDPWP
jgi:predicted PolB exonuclease-like 3'-5' exonuclease